MGTNAKQKMRSSRGACRNDRLIHRRTFPLTVGSFYRRWNRRLMCGFYRNSRDLRVSFSGNRCKVKLVFHHRFRVRDNETGSVSRFQEQRCWRVGAINVRRN
jgi:hypothetical protein